MDIAHLIWGSYDSIQLVGQFLRVSCPWDVHCAGLRIL